MIEISRGYIQGLILKFKIGRLSCPYYIDSTSSSLCIFIDCRMRSISNFFKMLHNLLESLIIKWNLFILSSREQNFNQHLGISFSKETFLPRRWLWIYYIGDVWRVPSCLEVCCGLSQDEREGCWLLRTRPATLTVAPWRGLTLLYKHKLSISDYW